MKKSPDEVGLGDNGEKARKEENPLASCVRVRTWGGSGGKGMQAVVREQENVLELCFPRDT